MVTFKWDDKRANKIVPQKGLVEGQAKNQAEDKNLEAISILTDLVKEGLLSTAVTT